uniref:hypothetical protein n=1 Tax=Thermaerobacillus caldiproteolyticus TaxID=247480 RepID=UPI001E626543|nr:hypothetical protein [Anoxybacillus caldiproteolyticus]
MLKTYFSIVSLRQLVDTLNRFGYFRRICGLQEVPHLSYVFACREMGSRTRFFRF